jgi:hypothetical protein
MNLGFLIPIIGVSLVLVPALHALYKAQKEKE